ncbi:alpha/beta hydrolase [Volucribacter amazonae]|uniref:Lysophospholipase n=1 Tax=Volucribacter amazonae TaxID=256731 RepID=A0A9X4SI88_9PAST|nr:alpha/beta fold hydrolase [Volucribacter amazonae]MDG6895350.1 lysophospholipase [Volucribacter amazonae]
MFYQQQPNWQAIMQALPRDYHLSSDQLPQEQWWQWGKHRIHLDCFRNPQAVAKLICLHGVGTNGRQISLIVGAKQASYGYETIMLDMPTYGLTETADRGAVRYDDWVQLVCDYIEEEARRDPRPIFLYGLSAGGMQTYHVACKQAKVKGIIGMTFLDQRLPQVRQTTAISPLMGKIGVPAMGIACQMGLAKWRVPMKWVSKMSALVNNPQVLRVMLKDPTSAGNWVSMGFLQSYMNYCPAIEPEQFSQCPILLTQPTQDHWTPLALSELTLGKITQVPVKTVLLPDGGHYPIEATALQTLNDAIHQFIQQQLG